MRVIDAETWAVVMRADDIAEIDRWVAAGGKTGKVVPFPKKFEPLGLQRDLAAETRTDPASGRWRRSSKRTERIRAELAEVLAKLREAAGETEPSYEER